MKTERSILSVETETAEKAFSEPMFAIPFREALELLFEVNLPLEMDGINFMQRTYTDKDGIVYRIGNLSADNALSYDELEQRLEKKVVMLIKYTANICAWGINFGISLGFISAQMQNDKPSLIT